jgi:di/tripeptidase
VFFLKKVIIRVNLIFKFLLMSKSLDYFKQITQIPRPSKKEEKIRNFLINWAGSRGFESVVDKV